LPDEYLQVIEELDTQFAASDEDLPKRLRTETSVNPMPPPKMVIEIPPDPGFKVW
jgi:hypothetical protein